MAKKLKDVKGIVFGSFAKFKANKDSDLDLFIVLKKKKIEERLKEKLDNLIIPVGLREGVKIHPEYQGIEIQYEDRTLVQKMIQEGKIIYSTGVFTFDYQQIGLQQYIIYDFWLKNALNPTMFSKVLHGRKSWYWKRKEKIIKEYPGMIDGKEIIELGRGVIMVHKSKEKDLKLFKKIFQSEKFRPDQLKIYPCQIIKDSPLAKTYKLIKYVPYNEKETKEILIKMMKIIPDYCRVMRMMREFPKEKLIKGTEKLDLRKDIEEEFRNKGLKIREIRMREIGFNKNASDLDAKIKIIEYQASGGKEYFLEFTNKENILFGLLRLRVFNKTAIIRELHIYGQALNLGEEGAESQHIGLGKRLIKKAEEIAKENGFKKLSVISGIGVREYYKKLGYKLDEEGIYMIKKL